MGQPHNNEIKNCSKLEVPQSFVRSIVVKYTQHNILSEDNRLLFHFQSAVISMLVQISLNTDNLHISYLNTHFIVIHSADSHCGATTQQ